jgi:hypothetical protein
MVVSHLSAASVGGRDVPGCNCTRHPLSRLCTALLERNDCTLVLAAR